MNIKKIVFVAFVVVFVSIFLFSSVSGANENDLEEVSLQMKWFHEFAYAGFYAAVEKGFYAEEGLKVNLIEGGPNVQADTEVSLGRAEYGVLASELIEKRVNGQPLVLLAVIQQHSMRTIVVREDSDINSPIDLVDRPIMLNRNEDIEFMAMFKSEDVPLERLNIIHKDAQANQKFIDGEIDALNGGRGGLPFLFMKEGIPVRLIMPINYNIDFYGNSIFTSEEEIENNPERVAAFTRASIKGWKYAMDNVDEVIDIMLEKYSPELSREALEFEARETEQIMLPNLIDIGHVNPKRIEFIAQTYAELGLIPKNYSLDGFIYYPKDYEFEDKRIDLTDQEKKWIVDNPEINLGFAEGFEPSLIINQDGSYSGMMPEIFDEISELTGLEVNIEIYNWSETIRKVESGELDGFLASGKELAKSHNHHYSDPFFSISPAVYAQSDSGLVVNRIEDLYGKKVSVTKGTRIVEDILESHRDKIEIVETMESVEMLRLVFENKVDAALGLTLNNYLINQNLFFGIETIYSQQPASGVVTSIKSDWPEYMSIVNKSVDHMGKGRINEITQKWIQPTGEAVELITLTNEEKKWIIDHPEIKIGYALDYEPTLIQNRDGTFSGSLIDIFDEINKLTGLEVQVELDSWQSVIDRVDNRELDGIFLSGANLPKSMGLSYSDPFLGTNPTVFARIDRGFNVDSVDDLIGKRVAYVEGTRIIEDILGPYEGKIEVVEAKTALEMLNMVNEKRVDVGFGFNMQNYLIGKNVMVGVDPIYTHPSSPDLVTSIRPDWPEYTSIINKAFNSIGRERISEISNKWVNIEATPLVALTAEEEAWLSEHPEITLGFTSEFEPLLIVDEDGNFSGILFDIYKNIEQLTGLKVNIEIGTWPEVIKKTTEGEIDGFLSSTIALAEDRELAHSKVLFNTIPTVFVRKDAPFEINSGSDLIGKKVSVLRGVVIVERALEPYEYGVEIVEVDSAFEMLNMVISGRVDAAVGMNFDNYLIGKNTIEGIQPVYFFELESSEAASAIRPDWPEAVSIINKALDQIGEDGLNEISQNWINVKIEERIDWESTLKIIGVVVLIFGTISIIIISWNKRLKREVERRREAEAKISELNKRLKVKAEVSESRLNNIIKNIPGVVHRTEVEPPWRVVFINENVKDVTGYSADYFLKNNVGIGDIMHKKDVERIKKIGEEVVSTGRQYEVEYRIVHKNGRVIWINEKGVVINKNGKPAYFDGVMTDVTEKKRSEYKLKRLNEKLDEEVKEKTKGLEKEKLIAENKSKKLSIMKAATTNVLKDVKAAKDELEKSNKLKDLFMDVMRHDLLSPAGIVKMSSQLALKTEDDPKKKEPLRVMEKNSERLIRMINNASIMAKLESGEKVNFSREDLSKILKESVEGLLPKAKEKGMKIVENIKEGCFAEVNPLIQNIFSNFISNAIKYSPKNSEVIVGIKEKGENILVYVEDRGNGVLAKHKKIIFERFGRFEKGAIKGTGLGLAISKRLTEIHNGKIWVRNRRGGGSIFYALIPKKHESLAVRPEKKRSDKVEKKASKVIDKKRGQK